METGPPALGLEDGAIDVECMLVEPQDQHLSMDSVMCFNKKTVSGMEHVSRSSGIKSSMNSSILSGGSDTANAQKRKDILNGEVLNVMPSEVQYFELDNDFSSMGEEYLLGVEFAESITNLDYVSSEGLQASVSDSQIQGSTAGSDTISKSNPFRKLDVQECQNDQYNIRSSNLGAIPNSHECGILVVGNPFTPRSCTSQNVVEFHNSCRSSSEDTLSDDDDDDDDDGKFSPVGEKDDAFEIICQDRDGARNISQGQEAFEICADVLPTQKRSRKPTQRYIDEFVDPSSTTNKRRRDVSSTRKNKSWGIKDHKKCLIPKPVKPPPEESSVIAIQVPFASLGNKDCPNGHACDINQNMYGMGKRDDHATSQKKLVKRDDYAKSWKKLEKRDDYSTRLKKIECVTPAQSKKRDPHPTVSSRKKKNDCTMSLIRKNKDGDDDDDNCRSIAYLKKDDSITSDRNVEVNGRRKHHRVWSISEVKNLIDGVAQYGVGRWSRIKKLFFSASPHRTSVDLKDKWRNLLKASGVLEQGSQQGEKKRNMAWRPLPKSILRRVCELATMYPYPKGHKHKITHFLQDSPDTSTEITLRDYKRILRSINGN